MHLDNLKTCSVEEQLIILCTRLKLSESQRIVLDRLVRDENLCWPTVLKKAAWYRVGAFLFHHLRNLGSKETIPTWVIDELKHIYFANGLENLQRRLETRKVLRALEEDSVPVIALKGVALLETVYPNGNLRPMSDFDLLVPEEMADAAQARVMEFGYLPKGTPEQQELQRSVHHHLPQLVNLNGMVGIIEVHSHIVPRNSAFRFDISSFWERAISTQVVGVDSRILAPEHQLIHLALHFFLSRRFGSTVGLAQICDMAETVRHYRDEMNWALLEKEVVEQNLQGPVYCGLYLAKSLLEAPVPESFFKGIYTDEINEEDFELFLRRRVLDDRRAVASQWVMPEKDYNLPNLVSGVVHRIFVDRADLESRYQRYQIPGVPVEGYFRRVVKGVSLLGQYWRTPMELWHEIKVQRWIHSISAGALAASRCVGTQDLRLPDKGNQPEDQTTEVQVR